MEKFRQPILSTHQECIPAHKMPDYLPATAHQPIGQSVNSQVQVQIFRHRTTLQNLTIPAVAEPLLVLVVSGAAIVEERVGEEDWISNAVTTDDFFLTMSPVPYEMRWQTASDGGFEVIHVYLSQGLLDLAARDVFAGHGGTMRLREASGERDDEISRLMRSLYHEMTSSEQASSLYLQGVAQALAVHLVRGYGDSIDSSTRMNALPAYKLHRAIAAMHAGLDSAFNLGRLSSEASMSISHFSRMFRKATGRSPSQYFIHMRMEVARQLLLESDLSILNVALNVGYASPSHFAQVFRRHTGVTPREYRHRS
ncbi:helix-turn-helix domain-containing protein [Pseudomonas sp. MWU13-2517]|uniref:helix-turn-helix domain-containing protein n=2 Tax=unclassified Pseudomonas TaxID=196821 RepID=UPI00200D0E21|nr:helix-turn-helix domain-containing protein [Pseudomonas sp. MWU13-2517]